MQFFFVIFLTYFKKARRFFDDVLNALQSFKDLKEYISVDPENSNCECKDDMKINLQDYLDTDLIKLRVDK